MPTSSPPGSPSSAISKVAPAKVEGRVFAAYSTASQDRLGFRAAPVSILDLDFEGIIGNRHRGYLRKADARVPYLKRGTLIRNQRHVSIVARDELTQIATALSLKSIAPETVGANIAIDGIPHLTHLPRGTKLFFPSRLILIIEDQNAPCSLAGEAVMLAANPDQPDLEIKRLFPKVAQGLRGLVATVEHPGSVKAGDTVTARLPAQWIYSVAKG
jgi:hypothetical protein